MPKNLKDKTDKELESDLRESYEMGVEKLERAKIIGKELIHRANTALEELYKAKK